MVWSPAGGGGGDSVNAGADRAPYRQADVGDISSHQHVPAPRSRPAPPGAQQFSTDADYGGRGGQDRGPPWRSRDGGGGTWNRSHHGPPAAASPEHRQQPQQQPQQQRGRTQALREHGGQGHPAKTSVSSRQLITIYTIIKTTDVGDATV